MNSPEELVRNTVNAINNPELLHIAESSGSPSIAEKTAEDKEYPLPLVREIRLLAVLKRDHPQVFSKATEGKLKSSKDDFRRIFPCYIKDYHDFNIQGELHIMLHPFLPPIFWDYEICHADGEPIFSCDVSTPLPYETEKHGVECTLSASSKSLPVGLTIKARKGYGYENDRQLTFERKLEGWSIKWARVIPRQPKDKDFSPIESYERITSWNNRGSWGDCVILRNLCLFLISSFCYPAGINSSLLFRVQTLYNFHSLSLSKENFDEYGCSKVEELPLPAEIPMWFNTLKSNKILLSMLFFDEEISHHRDSQEPIQEHIGKIIENTPGYIDGLKTLWNYFGFKNTEPRIYNHGRVCQMLPPWESKEKK